MRSYNQALTPLNVARKSVTRFDAQVRSSKAEGRKKSEVRRPKSEAPRRSKREDDLVWDGLAACAPEGAELGYRQMILSDFEFRPSFGLRTSAFGLRQTRRCPRRTTTRLGALSLVVAAVTLSLLLLGCGHGSSSGGEGGANKVTIQVKGSDTMVNLAQAWAEAYAKVAPDVDVEVSGGGSGVGIAALEKGTVDIADASRNMKPEEMETARKDTGKEPREFIVGYDALAIYVNKANPMNEITLDQIAQIYEEGGTITKWTDLGVQVPGAADQEIVRVSRQSSSGTYEFLREHVLHNKDYKLGSRDMNGSKEVVELVASTPTAIGYSGMGYATPAVKMLKVKKTASDPAYEPSVANALAKTYPIARSLQVYTLGEPQGAVKAYIDWIMSDAGQKVVEASGYVPLAAEARKGP